MCSLKTYCSFIIACITISFLSSNVYAQGGWQWAKVSIQHDSSLYDPYSSTIDKFGNLFVAGFKVSPDTLSFGSVSVYDTINQLLISKTDTSGNVLWIVPTQWVTPLGMVTDDSGNLFIYGLYDTTVTIDTITLTNTGKCCFLFKLSPSGHAIWGKNIINYLDAGGMGIDGANNIYLTGGFYDSLTVGTTTLHGGTANIYVFLEKYDPLGHPIWARSYGCNDQNDMGQMAVSQSGKIYVNGICYYDTTTAYMTIGSNTIIPGEYLVKFDSSGNSVWAENINEHLTFNYSATDRFDHLYATGNLTFIGTLDTFAIFGTDTITPGALTAKYDSSGHLLWIRSATDDHSAKGYSIAQDECGHLWVAGSMWGSTSTMNFNGHPLSSAAGSVDPTFIVQYDTSGNYISSMTLPCGGDDFIGISADHFGNFYVAGDYDVTSIVFGNDTFNAPFYNDEYLFIAKYKYDTAGCICLVTPVPNFSYTVGSSDTFSYTGTLPIDSLVWSFGDGSTSTLINPVHTFSEPGTYDVCVTIYTPCLSDNGVYCKNISVTESVTNVAAVQHLDVFPNPTQNQLTIKSSEPITSIRINNIVGQTVYKHNCRTKEAQIDVSRLPAGIYIVRINGSEIRKFTKE